MNGRQKIRYAVVGLGWFAQDAALPAFANAENSELVDRKSTRLNSSHRNTSRMPSSA